MSSRTPSWIAGAAMGGALLPSTLLSAMLGLSFVQGFDGLAMGLGLMAAAVLGGALGGAGNRSAAPGGGIAATLTARYGRIAGGAGAAVVVVACGLLLAAELAMAGAWIERFAHVRFESGAIAVAVAVLTVALASGHGFELGAKALLFAVVAAGVVAPLAIMSFETHGLGVPPLSFGRAVLDVAMVEGRLLETGAADFRSFAPHTKPFVSLDHLSFVATIVAAMAGGAVIMFGQLSHSAAASSRACRRRGLWAALSTLVVLASLPALAVYTKLAVYNVIAAGTPLTALPQWMAEPSSRDLLRVHGVSVALIEDAAAAVDAGHQDVPGVGGYLEARGRSTAVAWAGLKPVVRTAVVKAGQSLVVGASGETPPDAWSLLKNDVLPAAAVAAGNKSGLLTHGGLSIEPAAVVLMIPALTTMPELITALVFMALLAAALASGSFLLLAAGESIGQLVQRRIDLAGGAVVLVTAAAIVSVTRPQDPLALALGGLSLAGAGLLPALVFGRWWQRANGVAAMVAILTGVVIASYYSAHTALAPASFYKAWPTLSNASEASIRKFASLDAAVANAADAEAKVRARRALEELARGSAARPGLANWFGVAGPLSAMFALPIGCLVLVFGSLFARRDR